MAALWPEPHGDEAEPEQAIFADINITPLVDVMLVVLIIFMVGSSAMVDSARSGDGTPTERLELTLPSAGEAKAVPSQTQVLVLSIARDGHMAVGDEEVTPEHLFDTLKRLHDEKPAAAVVVDADGELSHAHVVHVLDEVQRAGFAAVGVGAREATR